MSIDPRTPILVGGGQVSDHDGGAEPVDLLARAARAAGEDAAAPGLLAAVDTVNVVGLLSWRYRDAGLLVAERIGARPRRTGVSGNGGSAPQVMVAEAASDIAEGRADVVLVGGAESWRTRMKLRATGERPAWTKQDDEVPAAPIVVPEVPMEAPSERRLGLDRPSLIYPLFEQAVRLAAGRSQEEHREVIGGLWARFSEVARDNPNAWTRRVYGADELTAVDAGNRMISSPYPKLLNSNNMVDQGAAVLLCSVEAAERFGVPRDRWVFPQSATTAHDTDAIAARGELHRSPAIRHGGARALELAGIGIDEVDLVDVYSCFPSAVQVAAAELGLGLDDPSRPLTVTGGLTFAGGPWNNYVTHSLATMIGRLRENPGAYGLVTANSGYLTKHAFGVYRTEPPAAGFRYEDVQAAVDAEPVTPIAESFDGEAELEAWTVAYGRDGTPERGFVAARTPDGARTLAVVTDPDDLAALEAAETAGRLVAVSPDGAARLTSAARV